MKINEMIQEYKKIISKRYSKEECLEIMIPLGIHKEVMYSIINLICNQPERTSEEDLQRDPSRFRKDLLKVPTLNPDILFGDMRCSEPSNERDGV